jgi:CheY-like chemotaxis protein
VTAVAEQAEQAGRARRLRQERRGGRVFEVLLVEDNPGDVRLVREALNLSLTGTDRRVELHVAADGEEAMAWLRGAQPEAGGGGRRTRRPDLLLLDLDLPGRGGLEVLAEVKGDPVLRRTPVVVLTGSATEDEVAGAYDRLANGLVIKPPGLDEFAAAVRGIAHFWLRSASLPSA